MLFLNDDDRSVKAGSQDVTKLDGMARVDMLGDEDWYVGARRESIENGQERIDAIGWASDDHE